MTIGERIRLRRDEIGMTQETLAEKVGYKSKASINRIECGKQELTQKKIKLFADALGMSASELMGWDDGEIRAQRDKLLWSMLFDQPAGEPDAEIISRVREYASFLLHEKVK